MDGTGDAEEGRNVVRLPRDWVGPPEELVPIGPRARARERERIAEQARASRRGPGDGSDHAHPTDDDDSLDADDSASSVPAADDFWGAGASVVHHAIRPSSPPPRVAPGEDGHAAPRRRLRLARPEFSVSLPRFSWPVAAAALVGAAIITVAAIGLGERAARQAGPTRSDAVGTRARHAARPSATSHGARSEGRLAAVPIRAVSERSSVVHLARSRTHGRHRSHHRSATTSGSATHAGGDVTQPAIVTQTVTTQSSPTPAPPAATEPAATAAGAASSGGGSSAGGSAASSGGSGTGSGGSSTGSGGSSTGSGGSGGSSSTHSSAASSGPLGPGSASGCDPKCS